MSDMEKIKKIAIEAALEAGKYSLEHIDKIKELSCKSGPTDLVTDVDKKCESIITDKIKSNFPKHSILAEESGEYEKEHDYLWLIDPIDGTINYAHGFPVFCTSIGIMYKGVAKIGVVYDPTRDELFFAEEGKGAFLNDKPMKVSDVDKVSESLLASGFAYSHEGREYNLKYFKKALEKAQAVRRPGAAAIDLCYVACGRLDGFWEFFLKPWDTAAGYLIVKEAGGLVTGFEDPSFDVYKKDILASNGKIHSELLEILKS